MKSGRLFENPEDSKAWKHVEIKTSKQKNNNFFIKNFFRNFLLFVGKRTRKKKTTVVNFFEKKQSFHISLKLKKKSNLSNRKRPEKIIPNH